MNKSLLVLAAVAGGMTLASSVPATGATRNYDCSKAGNANKAACKGKATAAAAPAAAKATTKTTNKTTTTAKVAASNVPAAAPAPAKPSMFQRLKNAIASSKTATTTTATAPGTVQRRTTTVTKSAAVEDRNPAGAIAQCKDGTYSHAKGRTGACSRHGGVAKWS